ncbi:MAG: hypothetical protein A2498_00850 [Lentisphaerae bacterium RIFOXYC12_FULL_60_16]|nr:MAG: hypothetical protein A2498_00850 [Lentisphaerae bacterium RIFOXYC12_FULL_60_16]OGV76275.1 MAG: hypothetical protein A2340_08835 [Lentisphaerae bacterium RIFOXYB12_FULL_60_10]
MKTSRKTKIKPTSKRLTPLDFHRMGELTDRKRTPVEGMEYELLLARFQDWKEYRDQGGIGYRDGDGLHAASRERRLSRVNRVLEWEHGREKQRRKKSEQMAGDVLRNNLVLSPGAMPVGPIGNALRALAPDARQIVNLRLNRNARGRRPSFREVAEDFRRKGKAGKTYTGERCRQIYKDALERHPELADYVDGLTKRKSIALDGVQHANKWNEDDAAEEIKAMTSEECFDKEDLNENDDVCRKGYRITAHPRRPLNLEKHDTR